MKKKKITFELNGIGMSNKYEITTASNTVHFATRNSFIELTYFPENKYCPKGTYDITHLNPFDTCKTAITGILCDDNMYVKGITCKRISEEMIDLKKIISLDYWFFKPEIIYSNELAMREIN